MDPTLFAIWRASRCILLPGPKPVFQKVSKSALLGLFRVFWRSDRIFDFQESPTLNATISRLIFAQIAAINPIFSLFDPLFWPVFGLFFNFWGPFFDLRFSQAPFCPFSPFFCTYWHVNCAFFPLFFDFGPQIGFPLFFCFFLAPETPWPPYFSTRP